jgi:hypothetical protein
VGSPDVTDIPQHVNAYDHTQCARKGRCEGQQLYNSTDCAGDLCHVCERVEEAGDEDEGAEEGAPQIGETHYRNCQKRRRQGCDIVAVFFRSIKQRGYATTAVCEREIGRLEYE